MGPGRRIVLVVCAATLLLPAAALASDTARVHDHGSFLHADHGDGPAIVAVGDDARRVAADADVAGDATVVLADDGGLAAWARQADPDGPVIVLVGTPDGDPIQRDVHSALFAPDDTDRVWERARASGLAVDDRVGEDHAAATTLVEAGMRPVVVDLGDGPRDPTAARQARTLVAELARDDPFDLHTVHEDDTGADDPADPDRLLPDLFETTWGPGIVPDLPVAGWGLLAVLGVLGGLAGGVKHVTPDNALDNESRAALYDTIQDQPGIHLRELARDQDMNVTSATWHVKKLEDVGLVRSTKLDGYKVFYPSEGGRQAERIGVAMNALRNDNARRLLEHVLDNPGSYQREIAEALDLNHATVRWHLKKLDEADLVTEVPLSHVTQYYVSAGGLHALQVVDERGDADPKARAGEGQAS